MAALRQEWWQDIAAGASTSLFDLLDGFPLS
jgi:hypothetical protein